jgi:hypothetical protein
MVETGESRTPRPPSSEMANQLGFEMVETGESRTPRPPSSEMANQLGFEMVETGESRTPRPEKGQPEALQAYPAFVLVRRATAGATVPDKADNLRRSVSASDRSTPANRRRTTARRGEACGRRHCELVTQRGRTDFRLLSFRRQFNEATAPRPAPRAHASLSKPVVPSAHPV